MEKVIRYKATDGRIFYSKKKCEEYEIVLQKIETIMKGLKPKPVDNNCRFTNGGGYIQQNIKKVEKAKKELIALGMKFFEEKDKWSFNAIGRLFCDSGYDCFYGAWMRLDCVDKFGREWGQPYYAANPTKGEQKEFVG